uniref:transposase n=1 Tax=Roseburia inulinivorans TaxID=360807 RepID=UPI004028930B
VFRMEFKFTCGIYFFTQAMIYDKHANLKYKYGNRHFWAEGYYVSTVGLNEATIKKYIQEQEKHDIALDKLSVKEYEDPFKGC